MSSSSRDLRYSQDTGGSSSSRRDLRRSKDTRESTRERSLEDVLRTLTFESEGRGKWPEHRTDTEDAFYEGYNYKPTEFATDVGRPIIGIKSLTKQEMLKEMNKGKKFSPQELKITKIREMTLEFMDKARRLSPGKTDTEAWSIFTETELRKFPGYLPNSVKILSAPNPDYNCFSDLFTQGRAGWLSNKDVKNIIKDHEYKAIAYANKGDKEPVYHAEPQELVDQE